MVVQCVFLVGRTEVNWRGLPPQPAAPCGFHTQPGGQRETCFKGTQFGADGRRGANESFRGTQTLVCLGQNIWAG